MRITSSLLAIALTGTILASPAHARTIAPAQAPSLSLDTFKKVTEELSSDAFEGRAPGTIGEEKTIALLQQEFQKAGLKPGNNGSWVQAVPLVEITPQNLSAITITGGKTPPALSFGQDIVYNTSRVLPRIDIKDSPLIFVGYGINAPEKGWNDYAGLDVKGKTVVILINDPDYAMEGLDGPFNGRAMTYYGRWTYKYEEAARQGAAAALIIHDTVPAAYGWNVVQSGWGSSQLVADTPEGGAGTAPLANGWISLDKARELFASAGQDLNAQMAAAKQPGFKALDLGQKISFSFDTTTKKTLSHNVIGILPGKTRPDEVVLHSAHWDHLGRCPAAPDGDDICNGAIDNATGTAALVTLAQAHAKAGPTDRSLVFLAVTGEESGLLGSDYYAANPVYPLEKTVGGINMDALSMGGLARNVTVIGKGKSQLDTYLERALSSQKRASDTDPSPEKGYYYRSDHFSFAKRGVPMLYFEGGQDLVKGGVEAGRKAAEDYTANRYHGPKDEYNPNWDWSGAMADVRLYYDIGRVLVTTTDWPNWTEGDEFRAIRDQSAASRK